MAYYLGVDVGTTYTAAAVWRDGRVEITGLGNRAPTIPSVVLLRDDGSMLVGEAAERRSAVEPRRVARQFKRRFGDPKPIVIGGTPYSADGLTAKVLRWVVDKVSETEGGPPTGVAVTYPANWGDYKTELLHQAITRADLDRVVTVTEPEAAAIHYASQERVRRGSIIAVYDLGGGTFDAAVLRKTDTGWEVLGDPQGVERLGGADFDEAVFQHVVTTLDGAVEQLDPDDKTALAAVARLRTECIDAKEVLSTDTEVTIPVLLPNIQTEVRLTRAEFEQMVRPPLEDSVVALDHALRAARVGRQDVSTVLLVGGSSRVPLVGQLVGASLGRPVALDAHPKYGVALGAAIVAVGQDVADAVDRSRVATVPDERAITAVPVTSPPVAPMGAFGAAVSPTTGPMPGGSSNLPFAVRPAPPVSTPVSTPSGLPSGGFGAPPVGYGQGPPPGGMYPSGPRAGSRGPLLLVLGSFVALGLVALLIVALSAGGGDGGEQAGPTATTNATTPSTTSTSTSIDSGSSTTDPTGTTSAEVSDTELRTLQDSCEADMMRDCDALWLLSPAGSDLEALAETCGSRDSAGQHQATCFDDFPDAVDDSIGIDLSPEALERLRGACEEGYHHYCDMLYWKSPLGGDLEAFAQTCGGRAPAGEPHAGTCHESFGSSESTPTTVPTPAS